MLKRKQQILVVVLLLTTGQGAVAGDGRRSPETDLAAPGAPLYEKAVKESVVTLMSKEEQAELDAQGRPPSPGPDYYWCKNCKTYHKKQSSPASAQQPAGAQKPGAAPIAAPAAPLQPDAAAARPPSPGADSYWCAKCKAYHKKLPVQNQPGAAAQASPGGDARPPSPGADYYYCENCKTYHRRQPGASPAAPHAPAAVPPAAGVGAAQAADADYYYCENCKTYHRRQPAAQQSVEDLIVEGATNSPYLSPLIAP